MSPHHPHQPARRSLCFVALAAVLAVGCGGTDTPDAAVNICDGFQTAYDAFAAGIEKPGQSGKISVKLLSATPAPPVRGTNAWTIQVMANQAPAAGAFVTRVKPFMPDHGHGTSVKPTAGSVEIGDADCATSPDACKAAVGADGKLDISNLDFMMPGVWTIQVSVETASKQTDAATFAFCIDG